MSCSKCDNEVIRVYRLLSKKNGKEYVKYIQDNNLKIVSKDDFYTLVKIGEIEESQQHEILV